VVIQAAAGAWQREGYQVIGTAVAGATAERLGQDAGLEKSVTTDALIARVESGSVAMDSRTVVLMDEAGMADTHRLSRLTELTAERGSKLVLVGDQAQLPAIGAGGMFPAVQKEVPTAEVTEVRRANHDWEREAWQQVRSGEAERALASYQARERLHVSDTREEAAERMVSDWDQARRKHPGERTVMLTDASNVELDRINALAQERRAQAGELGAHTVDLPGRAYGLAAGDEVIFTAAHQPPGQPRVENGTLGTVVEAAEDSRLAIETKGAEVRDVELDTEEFSDLRLAYAQHVYKAQGRTVDRAFVLTGGWQTDRERSYVALSRARERTDLYVSREDLGEEGMDAGAIERLGDAMEQSHAEQASIGTPELQERSALPGDPLESDRESEAAQAMRESELRHDRDRGLGWSVE
jgi:ATP-dependent exoDNAse (exonuclease V) alpha subunit